LHFAVGGQSPDAETMLPQPRLQFVWQSSLQSGFFAVLVTLTAAQFGLEARLHTQVQVQLWGGATHVPLQHALGASQGPQVPPH
jgi:hypothetical protein